MAGACLEDYITESLSGHSASVLSRRTVWKVHLWLTHYTVLQMKNMKVSHNGHKYPKNELLNNLVAIVLQFKLCSTRYTML